MQKSNTKIRHQIYIPVYLFLLFSVSITSCTGQENKGLKGTKVESTEEHNSDSTTAWIDPLFFNDGQLCQHLRKIFQDNSGNLWFGTNNYGLLRYDGDTLVYFSEEELNSGRITGISEDKAGNVWVSNNKGLSKYDGKSFTNFVEKEAPFENEAWSLLIDSKDRIWVGTNEGVRQFDGEAFIPFPIPKAPVEDTTTYYAADRISSILEDKTGTIWFGTDGFGICKYDGKNFTFLTKKDGLPDNNIGGLMQDSKGNIWIGTMYGGVSKYDGQSFINFTQDGVIEGIELGGMHEDKNGNIWLAFENHGVYRYDGTSFTNFNEKDGLNTNTILDIFEDREGRFWFGGWGGLFRYEDKSFVVVTKDGPWD